MSLGDATAFRLEQEISIDPVLSLFLHLNTMKMLVQLSKFHYCGHDRALNPPRVAHPKVVIIS